MASFVIGKQLKTGFEGGVSRSRDAVIECFAAKGEDIAFGDPVVRNSDGTVSKFKQTSVATDFIGFAVRAVKQAKDDSGAAVYKAGDATDVLVRGSIGVKVSSGTPAAGGAVYLRTGAGTGHVNGQIVAAASTTAGETVQLSGVVFASGETDAGGVSEVTVLQRNA